MGGGCYRIPKRDLFFVGGFCENGCFRDHGGCESSSQFEAVKTEVHCEYRPDDNRVFPKTMDEINHAIDKATNSGRTIFLYAPDMFSDVYFNGIFKKLPNRNGSTHIAVNACVKTLANRADWSEIYSKGIREIWIGVESANIGLRNKYHKPYFVNNEVLRITRQAKESKINICWFLVDGPEDTDETRLETYGLVKRGDPYRIHIGQLERY